MPDKKYDVEEFFKNTISIFQSKLNAKIQEINTEKNDTAIEIIDNAAWFIAKVPKIFSFPQFVICGILDDTITDRVESAILEKITLQIEIGLVDKNWGDLETFYRLLRYQRALQEVVFDNFQSFGNGRQPIIEKLPPAAIVSKENAFQFSGINVTISQD